MDVSIYIPDMWKLLYLSWCSGLGTKCNDSEAEQGSADTDNYFKKKKQSAQLIHYGLSFAPYV